MRSIGVRLTMAFSCVMAFLLLQGVLAIHNAHHVAAVQGGALEEQIALKDLQQRLADTRLTAFKLLGTMNPHEMDYFRLEFRQSIDRIAEDMTRLGLETDLLEQNRAVYEQIFERHYDFYANTARQLINSESKRQHEELAHYLQERFSQVAAEAETHVARAGRFAVLVNGALCLGALAVALGWAFLLKHSLTDRHQAEARLRESEERYRFIIETAGEGVWMIDRDAKTTFVNRQMADMLGYTVEEMLGEPVTRFLDGENRSLFGEQWEKRRKGEACQYDMGLQHRDGSVTWVFVNARPIIHETEGMTGSLAMITDITQRKHAEEERARLEDKLRQAQKMEAVGQLAGGVAHDFNNLLQAIRGYGDMALDDVPDDGPVAESLREILKAAERAGALVRQLLTFSRRDVVRPKHLDVSDIITGLMKMLSRLIGEHIILDINPGDNLPAISADPGQVEQLIMNLCVNARDAMPEGGRLQVRASETHLDEPFCETNPWARPGDYIRIEVADTGLGIPPEALEHIFEPFFTTKEVGEGTGLGLATVYGIVRQHDGLINVESESGKGTRFSVYMPIAEDAQKAPEPVRDTRQAEGGSETILIAEDEEQVRNLTAKVLRRAGYEVLEACDGEEAIAICRQRGGAVDMAVLDVVMPHRSGRSACQVIRSIVPGLPVLFCSGYTRDHLGTGAQLEANTELLPKPFTPTELLAKVRHMLGQPRDETR